MPAIQPTPVARLRTTDPEMIRASVRGVHITAMQCSPTATESELTRIPMPSQQLDLVELASAFEFKGVTSRDNATIIFVLATPGHGHSFNFSTDTGPAYMGFWPTEGPLHYITPAGYRNASLTLPLELLVREMESRDVRPPSGFFETGCAMKANPCTLLAMEKLVAEIRSLVAGRDGALDDPRWRLNLERVTRAAFADALAEGIRHRVPEANLSLRKSERRFQQARDYIADRLGQPIYLDELCRACGLSRRGLQKIFREKIGISPMEYLSLRRLHGVRQDLKANVEWGGVKAAALEWGFWHLGRFSAEYRRIFGELPSATLANEQR
ncbi:MAG: helix-turn-helix domain-containing protein [Chthoniobacteraceae bacterium]